MKKHVRRESFAIASEILYHALGGARKTSIAGSCNLRTKICRKYIAILLGKGLLETNEYCFVTTERGKQFLATYQKLELIWTTSL